MPFVQGQLRNEYLEFNLETECAHCSRKITIKIDSNLEYSIADKKAEPLIFVPQVDINKLEEPSIIDVFCRNSDFFWSEEHARAYRRGHPQLLGTFMTLEQCVCTTPRVQGALFNFPRE